MIVSAYAGTGKTTFAARESGAVDLPSMPCSWILPDPGDRSEDELEREKGALYHLRNPLFPDNYIVEILKAERKYDYVLIPTSNEVVRRLQKEYGRKVLLCYPTDDLKAEYRERFLRRGNSESFLELFVECWDGFLGPIKENKDGVHIPLGSGIYLTDFKERFDIERIKDNTAAVPMEQIAELEHQLTAREKELALYITGDLGSCIYSSPNLADPEEKRFLYQIGRKIYGAADLLPMVLPSKMLKNGNSDRHFWTTDKEKVKAYVDWYVDSSKRMCTEFEMLR
ncbi:MAG: hypothetical protein IJ617_02860 [Oscillospiraceae bacterium]|nr:hypothetical protein [Oscillospiraceae bacterium]